MKKLIATFFSVLFCIFTLHCMQEQKDDSSGIIKMIPNDCTIESIKVLSKDEFIIAAVNKKRDQLFVEWNNGKNFTIKGFTPEMALPITIISFNNADNKEKKIFLYVLTSGPGRHNLMRLEIKKNTYVIDNSYTNALPSYWDIAAFAPIEDTETCSSPVITSNKEVFFFSPFVPDFFSYYPFKGMPKTQAVCTTSDQENASCFVIGYNMVDNNSDSVLILGSHDLIVIPDKFKSLPKEELKREKNFKNFLVMHECPGSITSISSRGSHTAAGITEKDRKNFLVIFDHQKDSCDKYMVGGPLTHLVLGKKKIAGVFIAGSKHVVFVFDRKDHSFLHYHHLHPESPKSCLAMTPDEKILFVGFNNTLFGLDIEGDSIKQKQESSFLQKLNISLLKKKKFFDLKIKFQ